MGLQGKKESKKKRFKVIRRENHSQKSSININMKMDDSNNCKGQRKII